MPSGYLNSPQQELKILKSELVEMSIDGEIIPVIDKNGKTRKYKLNDYAKMVIYTGASKSQAEATVNIALEYESDLVQVSRHYTNCQAKPPLINCQDIEGRIFSISGNDPDFPPLDFEFPPHIGCKHTLSVVFKEMIKHLEEEKYG